MTSEDGMIFRVTVSSAGDYSIWPDDRMLPRGWDATEIVGDRATCLSYIDREWTRLSPAMAADGYRVRTTNVGSILEGK